MTRRELDLLTGPGAFLAEVPSAPAERYLGFVVGDEHLALPIGSVREVVRVPPVTEVPGAPPVVRGVVALHGRIVTVVDLRRRLAVPDPAPGESARLLLVPSGDEDVALLVDAVTRIHRVAPDSVEPAGALPGSPRPYVAGVARVESERDRPPTLVVLADLDALSGVG